MCVWQPRDASYQRGPEAAAPPREPAFVSGGSPAPARPPTPTCAVSLNSPGRASKARASGPQRVKAANEKRGDCLLDPSCTCRVRAPPPRPFSPTRTAHWLCTPRAGDRNSGVLKSRPKMVAMRVKLAMPAEFSEMRCVYSFISCGPSRFEYLPSRLSLHSGAVNRTRAARSAHS